MIPYLNKNTAFPDIHTALNEPNGLLAAGGDLSTSRLMNAYQQGIFPWFSPDEPILWWSPNPRTVFILSGYKTPKSVKQTLRKLPLKITINTDFDQVIHSCATPRYINDGTWITKDMIKAYSKLHQKGYAHSVEVWLEDELVGGIYGVALDTIFCAESMFSRISNGSKIALTCLVYYLKKHQFKLIDCQVLNPHLKMLGAVQIPRKQYIKQINEKNMQEDEKMWTPEQLDWQSLIL